MGVNLMRVQPGHHRILFFIFLLSIPVLLNAQSFSETSAVNINLKRDLEIRDYSVFDRGNDSAEDEKSRFDKQLTFDFIEPNRWTIQLFEHEILGPDFQLTEVGKSGTISHEKPDIKTYIGSLKGDNESTVRLTEYNGFLSGTILSQNELFVLQPASEILANSKPGQLIIYNTRDRIEAPNGGCGVTDMDLVYKIAKEQSNYLKPNSFNPKSMACEELELAIAADYSMFQKFGSIQAVLTHVLTIINLTAGDYTGTFINDISMQVVELAVSVCADCDPWTSSTDALDLLVGLEDWAAAGGFRANHDLGQLWTNRSFDGNFTGLAFQGTVCLGGRYNVVRDFTSNPQGLRAMVSHEFGHNFNAIHNYEIGEAPCDGNPGRDPLIMDPYTISSATSWSNGSEPCVLPASGSIGMMNTAIAGAACLGGCAAAPCARVTNLSISNISQFSFNVNWSGTTGSYRVRVRDGLGGDIVNTIVSNSSYNYNGPALELCNTYEVTVESSCGGGNYSDAESILFATPFNTQFELMDARVNMCNSNMDIYSLDVYVEHGGGLGSQFMVDVDGHTQFFSYQSAGMQMVTLENLSADGEEDIDIVVMDVQDNGIYCNASMKYNAPNGDCDEILEANFNSCRFPYEWTKTSTATQMFSEPFDFRVDNADRTFQNYNDQQNVGSPLSIDGSCMAYLDDDLSINNAYTGTVELITRSFDMSEFMEIMIEFEYNFHRFDLKGPNNSNFRVEVFDGSSWQQVLFDNTDVCPWSDVWDPGCFEKPLLDVSQHMNSNFRVKFIYTDGNDGKWTGMICIDNFRIYATRGATVPVELSSFSARKNKDQSILNWQVSSEIHIDSYIVERSFDSRSFQKLVEKSAIGETGALEYQFIDDEPLAGINYYRLSSLDRDGRLEYHGVRTVSHKNKGSGIYVYPTLISEQSIQIESDADPLFKFELYDATGRLIRDQVFSNRPNEAVISLDPSELQSSVYYLRIESENGEIKTEKLIKL